MGLAVADQDDLEIGRHRRRLERLGTAPVLRLGRRLDAQLAAAERALEPFPGVGLAQQAGRIDQQESAAGPVQRAGPHQTVVGHHLAHPQLMLDTPDQIAEARVVLLDHRRAAAITIVHQQVDQVARR